MESGHQFVRTRHGRQPFRLRTDSDGAIDGALVETDIVEDASGQCAEVTIQIGQIGNPPARDIDGAFLPGKERGFAGGCLMHGHAFALREEYELTVSRH